MTKVYLGLYHESMSYEQYIIGIYASVEAAKRGCQANCQGCQPLKWRIEANDIIEAPVQVYDMGSYTIRAYEVEGE